MTCIIAGKCDDGIVLVAERKVRYDNGNVRAKEKIFIILLLVTQCYLTILEEKH